MHVTSIDIDRSPKHEEYEQTIRVWFDNGGSIRFVEDIDGRIIEQAFSSNDRDTVWDDMVVGKGDDSLREYTLEVLSIIIEQLRNENVESSLLKAVTGNESLTPTNVEYEQ